MKIKTSIKRFFLKDYFGGFLFAILLCFFLSLNYDGPNKNFLYDYQTFITSLLLAVIGLATILVMHHQYKDEIYRKRLSMKAKMPDDISTLTDYTRECLYYIRDGGDLPECTKALEALKTFKDAIEFLDTPSAEAIYELVTFFQIHRSRLKSYEPRQIDSQYSSYIYDTVILNHLALRTFEYARNTEPYISNSPASEKELLSSLRSMIGFFKIHSPEEKYFELEKIIIQKFDQNRERIN